ncbi:hypothetical protein PG994_010289 [Apiospora phragmitis]|uniref:N-acetyltransferase domain-containing protein n=1 Tax=Apiospora phragmitis TaxID=2905665 RepID=A0ABR1TS24_9PEZI
MADSTSNTVDEWAIELIPDNDIGRAFYLAEYKPFRLAALKQDPEAFGSSYAREAAFPDETWLQRLSNPRIKTFVAVCRHDRRRRILSAVSLVGPMPHAGQTVSNPTQALLSQTAPSDDGTTTTSNGRKESGEEKQEGGEGEDDRHDDDNNDASLLYQSMGVYTRPEARGKGLGLTLMATAVECARQEARRNKQPCQLGVEVYKTNLAAIAFYRRCGFEARGPRCPSQKMTRSGRSFACITRAFFLWPPSAPGKSEGQVVASCRVDN